ncbi:early protein 7 [Lambdapapillomavirus 2]|uniref:Protein E7 n=4 Tax=Papillomaviridae TaxID=151340 RepID=VE7_COPV6|nr:early protein 7 [Lambdapapillomavirus 2]Q89759.1 RecName: Full=Protein E7 [Canine oral papillomavirus (strain Y62)]QBA88844.1 early protein 7 [Canine papillomavirus]AAA61745.1 transforming protein [Lambdapapillomavirus 2]AOI33379.1 putative E7 protein [Lambdapapillomavirus 2]AOI33386.1 putative E7 protein [Lambdapapillomavirus 2]QBA88850.1 early protein 7 [Canine papillomavirus]
MIGQCATLLDIVLTEQPEPIDLQCYEQLPSSDEEEEEEEPTEKNVYRIEAACGFCGKGVRFFCLSQKEDLRVLQVTLLSLSLVCTTCVQTAKLDHGG